MTKLYRRWIGILGVPESRSGESQPTTRGLQRAAPGDLVCNWPAVPSQNTRIYVSRFGRLLSIGKTSEDQTFSTREINIRYGYVYMNDAFGNPYDSWRVLNESSEMGRGSHAPSVIQVSPFRVSRNSAKPRVVEVYAVWIKWI